MTSFQCSRHATPASISNVFKTCAKFQKEQDLNKFVSVVVLDEVGLAEDSENMPLKVVLVRIQNSIYFLFSIIHIIYLIYYINVW